MLAHQFLEDLIDAHEAVPTDLPNKLGYCLGHILGGLHSGKSDATARH
jgi:hypothetical protein